MLLIKDFKKYQSIQYFKNKQKYKKITLCEICNKNNFSTIQNIARVGKVGQYGFLNIVICLNCSHKFVNPRFVDDFYIKYYLKKYRKIAFGYTEPTKKYLKIQMDRGNGVLNYYRKKIGKPGKMLDHGCASGGTMLPWRNEGWNVSGFDPHIPSVNFGKKKLGLDIHASFGEKINFKNNEFKVVMSLGSLEHSYDINKSLKEIYRVLKPKGQLIIRWRSDKIIGSSLEYFNHNHYRYFSRFTWGKILNKHGFKIIEFTNKKLEKYNSYEYILAQKTKIKKSNIFIKSKTLINLEIKRLVKYNLNYFNLSIKLCKKNFFKKKNIEQKINFVKKEKKKLLNNLTKQSANRFIFELKKYYFEVKDLYEKKLDKKIFTKKKVWTFKSKLVSKNFDQHVKKSVPFYDHSHKIAVGLSEFFLGDGSVCCDLGCSTGTLLNKILIKNKEKKIKYYGFDSSASMIRVAGKNKKIKFKKCNIVKSKLPKTDFFLSLYTMQFIPARYRQDLFNKIYNSLNWGGAFFICEKIRGSDARFQDILNFLYFDFKKEQKLKDDEILNKEQSLRGVMDPFTINANLDFLKRAGFKDIMPVYQYLNFKGFLAIK